MVEEKFGDGELGSRGDRVQQGTHLYRNDILAEMRRRGDVLTTTDVNGKPEREDVTNLRTAIREGRFHYTLSRTRVDSTDSLKLGTTTMQEFSQEDRTIRS